MVLNPNYPNVPLNRAIKKSWQRLIPLMFLLYLLAFLDRVNIGFAQSAMQAHIGLSAKAYAFGGGIFFLAYALTGIPSNLLLQRFGAKIWISFTTIAWGFLSALTGVITSDIEFIILRFLLGIAEAGFYPGILLLTTIYFPDKIRGSIISAFVIAVPFALTLGAPLSGALLELDGLYNIAGWRWMFFIEGLPAVILGVFCYFYIDDKPATASFLTKQEREVLSKQIAIETPSKIEGNVRQIIKTPIAWHLAFIYGILQISVYGMLFFLPIQMANLIGTKVGFISSLITAIPWAISIIGVYYIPRYTDKYPKLRSKYAIGLIILSGLGLFISSFSSPVIAIIALCFCTTGFLAVQPIFWTIPPRFLSDKALAATIALCTALGAICSAAAPLIRVYVEEATNSSIISLGVLAISAFICALLIALIPKTTTFNQKES